MLENVFSWSKSRDEEFRECQRKYFYARYLSWGGWDRHANPRVRLAYIYKNLKNRYAWKGETVHHLIENLLKSLKSGKPMLLENVLADLTKTMRADYLNSKNKKHHEDPKKNVGLFEHEYAKPVTDTVWKELHDSSADCLRNFYRSDFYSKDLLVDNKDQWLVIEDLEEYDFEGSKIYVKLDFARSHNGLVEIYDWKTGKTESKDAWIQIGTYMLYAMGKWKIPHNRIKAYLFNLTPAFPVASEVVMDQAMIDKAKSFIAESVGAMKAMLQDPVKNIPKPESAFAYAQSEKICQNCAFMNICSKYNP